ncbi:RluA family pseudouridine synthase [Aquabacter spiritensis]|uniref:Pseudouridine synthase n=1 Tax=Aquabacter spiritensis TaxID=933073 RepID=A0A4R3M5X4_9HYPH|nr:RluA family pseudouridine synthase [Aquabacter spiritensis]TCT06887.1 ribosomal large subunit pseudouridine synthase D [Aquabacter spiritensis]
MGQPNLDEDEALDLSEVPADLASETDHHITVKAEEAGQRTDRVLAARLAPLSRTRIQRLVAEGRVENGDRVVGDAAERVNPGDVLCLRIPAPEPATPEPEAIPLAIAYEDDQVIVIDKPAGLVVHPAPGNWSGTLVNALLHQCRGSLSGIGGVRRPGIVHRLDKDTSGLLVAAKTDVAHRALSAQFADHGRAGDLERAYLAFVWGAPEQKGTIDAPIDRHPASRVKMAVRPGGRQAVTRWRRIETFADATGAPVAALVECQLETGRTHQIRVHMAHIGHPLLGDEIYGPGFRTKLARLAAPAAAALSGLGRQALHATRLGFAHPTRGEVLSFESPLPPDLAALRQALAAS